MGITEAIQLLKDHNIWRRYDGEIGNSPKMTDPSILGIAIDTVVSEFENSDVVSKNEQLKCFIDAEPKICYNQTKNYKECKGCKHW
jgi:hypothetical protein